MVGRLLQFSWLELVLYVVRGVVFMVGLISACYDLVLFGFVCGLFGD